MTDDLDRLFGQVQRGTFSGRSPHAIPQDSTADGPTSIGFLQSEEDSNFSAPMMRQLRGVLPNGDFAKGPPQAAALSLTNAMPFFTYNQSASSSTQKVTFTHTADTDYGSGYKIVAACAAGGAGADDAYLVTKTIPVPRSFSRQFTVVPMVTANRVTNTPDLQLYITTEILDASGASLGSYTTSKLLSTLNAPGTPTDLYCYLSDLSSTYGSAPPATASDIKVSIGLKRVVAGVGTGSVDLGEMRVQIFENEAFVTDKSDTNSYGYGWIYQDNGVMVLQAGKRGQWLDPNITISTTTGRISLNAKDGGSAANSDVQLHPGRQDAKVSSFFGADVYARLVQDPQVGGTKKPGIYFGPGDATPDTDLYRDGVAKLKTDGDFQIVGLLTGGNASSGAGSTSWSPLVSSKVANGATASAASTFVWTVAPGWVPRVNVSFRENGATTGVVYTAPGTFNGSGTDINKMLRNYWIEVSQSTTTTTVTFKFRNGSGGALKPPKWRYNILNERAEP